MQTEIEKLPEVVEAILFVAGQGVEIKDIAEKLEVDIKQIKEAIETLKEKHSNDGINVITYKNSVQMCSNSAFAEDIAVVLNPIREKQLTKAALETLAIIAYKQPITKLEIEQVRNVNSDYAMQVLTNFKLVEVVGRKDAVGKPLLYGTTDEFLKHFNLQDINDLPDYDEILERIEIIHAEDKKGDSLYGSTEIIPEDQLADARKNEDANENAAQEKTNETSNAEQETDKTNNNDAEGTTLSEEEHASNNVATINSLDSTNENGSADQEVLLNNKEELKGNNAEEIGNITNADLTIGAANNYISDLDRNGTDQIADSVNSQTQEDLEKIKETLLSANNSDEDAIIDSFKDKDVL